jgi:hypothetical protein
LTAGNTGVLLLAVYLIFAITLYLLPPEGYIDLASRRAHWEQTATA